MTVYNAPADDLINRVAIVLKEELKVEPPAWAWHVKTGCHKDNIPVNPDWWHVRVASLLRKIYLNSPQGLGVERLRSIYGGAKDNGTRPAKHTKASGNVIRKGLQQLEKMEFVTRVSGKGRVISSKGQSFLDKIAFDIMKDNDELEKYLK